MHTHKSSWVFVVGTDLAIDANNALLQDLLYLGVVESVLQTVTEEQIQRKAFPEFVRTTSGADGEDSTKLIEHPVVGSRKALQMMSWSTSHFAVTCTSS